MSEDAVISQREHEDVAREVRWPALVGEPEIDEAVTAEIDKLIAAQMVEEGEDGSA